MSNLRNPLLKTTPPTTIDWLMFFALVILGGSSFAGIKGAVATAPPLLIAGGRLWVGALVIFIYMYVTGARLPSLFTKDKSTRKINSVWLFMIIGSAIGYALPFILFPFAQKSVDSLLAGIYMAFMPLMTVVMGYFFAGEELTKRRLSGFLLGTTGVIFLMGPSAIAGIKDAGFIAQLALLIAVACYSIGAIIIRRAPTIPSRSYAAGTLICAAMMLTPLILSTAPVWKDVSVTSWASIAYLGLFPTGLASIFIFSLIRRVGPGFMASGNYLTPLVAIFIGIILFGEAMTWQIALGLVAILVGLFLSQPSRRMKTSASAGQTIIVPRK